jgi:hypothetical protein
VREVIALLEQSDTSSHRRALWKVLTHGPFYCAPAALDQVETGPAEMVDHIAAVLLRYTRNAVEVEPAHLEPIDLTGVQLSTIRIAQEALSFTDGPLKGLAAVNWTNLLHMVGLRDIRRCGASDCPHLFVKIHRRNFCSERCQKRVYKRREREDAARAQIQRRRRRVTARERTER